MNKFINSGILLLSLFVFITPVALADTSEEADTRIERYKELTDNQTDSTSSTEDSESDTEVSDEPDTRIEKYEDLTDTQTDSIPSTEDSKSDNNF